MTPSAPSPGKVCFGAFEADLQSGELRKFGIRLKIQGQPFKLLCILLERPGEVVTREELQQRLWGAGTVVDFDHGLGTAVNKIREVLGDSAENPRFIETLSRRGFRFIAPVQPAAVPVVASLAAVPAPSAAAAPAGGRRLRSWLLPGGLAAVALAGAVLFRITSNQAPPRLLRATQITHSGHIAPGDTAMENFPGLVTDGTRLYFHEIREGRVTLSHASVSDGEAKALLMPPEIAGPSLGDISPDGSKLLVRNHLAPEVEQPLWVVPTGGGAARRVLSVLAHDATWTPDGQSIVYASGHELFLTRSGGDARKLASTPGRAFWLRWSPDGSMLRFTLLDSETRETSLWELSADGQKLQPLLPHWHTPSAECCGNWTRDGKYFLFRSTRDGISNIWALPAASRFLTVPAPRQITAGPLNYLAPVPARDPYRMFVIGVMARTQLLRYDAVSGGFVRYMPHLDTAGRTAFTKDGQRVAWVNAGDGSLWQSRLDGMHRLQLLSRPMQVYMMRWSPDARRILFMGKEPGQPWKLYVVAADGGSSQMLMGEVRNEADPDWSSDGNSVVFGRLPEYMAEDSTPKAIQILDLKTKAVSTLPGSAGLFSPRWSPDGRYIAAMPLDQRKLMIFDLSTRQWSEVAAHSVDNPVWSKDGKYIYFHSFMEEGQPIYRFSIPSRRMERVAEFRDVQRANAGPGEYSFGGLTPDDSPLVSVQMWSGDIYALDWEGH